VSAQHVAFARASRRPCAREALYGGGIDLPEANRPVLTARGEAAAVWAESGLEDDVLVTDESGGSLVRTRIQEQHGLVILGPDRQPTAVGAVRQGSAFGREE
jgi:hypothetical protein